MDRLTPISPGVVHSSPFRTRLKAARWQEASPDDIAMVKDALLRVPGVTDVRPLPRGYVIEHEARPDVVENIGQALAEVSPVLLEDLTRTPVKVKKKGPGMLDEMLDRLPRFNLSMPEFDFHSIKLTDAGSIAKKTVPFALAGSGILMLLEGEAILAGVGPLALFYLAYDAHWKMQQEKTLNEIVAERHE